MIVTGDKVGWLAPFSKSVNCVTFEPSGSIKKVCPATKSELAEYAILEPYSHDGQRSFNSGVMLTFTWFEPSESIT